MNCARLRLSTETTTIFVREGWLVIEVADPDELRSLLTTVLGEKMLTVGEVSSRTGFSPGAVREWIKKAKLPATRIGREYRVREGDLERLIKGLSKAPSEEPNRHSRRRKAVSV